MHYRRYFVFNDKYYHSKWSVGADYDKAVSTIRENFITKKTLSKIGFNEFNIQNIIENNDIIVSYPSRLDIYYPIERANIRNDYEKNIPDLKVKDFDLMIDIINSKYPNCQAEINNFINSPSKYMFQMFIMKKELFFNYCEFLFEILFEIEQKVDFRFYEIYGVRSLGYLAEIMLTIFLIIQNSSQQLKIRETGIVIFEYAEPYEKLLEKSKKEKYCYLNYLIYKIRYLLTYRLKEKEELKNKYKNYKKQHKFAVEFKKVQKLGTRFNFWHKRFCD